MNTSISINHHLDSNLMPKTLVSQISPNSSQQLPILKKQNSINLSENQQVQNAYPLLSCNESQNSTDDSSSSSTEDSRSRAASAFTVSPFEEEAQSNNQIGQTFFHPLQKSFLNENVYFPRVFSHNMMEEQVPSQFLSRHEITPSMRARMVDWMIEVLKAYNYSETTFSLAVGIMDTFFSKCPRALQISELHIIGITSMFIASKYEEIIPFTLQKVFEKIGHSKIPIQTIKKMEAEILNCLEFNLTMPTIATQSSLMIKFLETQGFFYGHQEQQKEAFLSLNDYVFKLATFDYQVMSKYSSKAIAIASLFVTSTFMDLCFQTQFPYIQLHYIVEMIRLDYDQVIILFNYLLQLAQSYETIYPQLKNLKKHNLDSINALAQKMMKQPQQLQHSKCEGVTLCQYLNK